MTPARCERCDRTLAVENNHDGGCTCEQCSAWCWSAWGGDWTCIHQPVDWRARALKAEAALEDARRAQPKETP